MCFDRQRRAHMSNPGTRMVLMMVLGNHQRFFLISRDLNPWVLEKCTESSTEQSDVEDMCSPPNWKSNWFATRIIKLNEESTDAFDGTKVTSKGSDFPGMCSHHLFFGREHICRIPAPFWSIARVQISISTHPCTRSQAHPHRRRPLSSPWWRHASSILDNPLAALISYYLDDIGP